MKNIVTVIIYALTISIANGQVVVSTLVDNIQASGGLKIGPDNSLYAANFGISLDMANGTQVWRVGMDGSVELFATGLSGASGNDFDSQGNLFQSNISAGTVSKITPTGQVSTFATIGISCNVGIVIDENDNLFICNCCSTNGNTIRRVTPGGQSSQYSSSGLYFCPNGITADGNGNLYVSNFSNGNIIKIAPGGAASLLAVTPGAGGMAASNGHIVYSPYEDVLYVASHGSSKIYRLTLNGVLTTFAGSGVRGNDDGPASQATFSRPNGLALSSTGDTLFVNSSIPTTNAGGRPLNPSKIRMLTGLLGNSNIGEIEKSLEFLIAPNPTTNSISVQSDVCRESHCRINIFNSTFDVVHAAPMNRNSDKIEVVIGHLSSGTYYFQLISDKGMGMRPFLVVN